MLETRASVSDGGMLSYQWFSGVGFAATPINGANGSMYLPDTSVPGTQGYCCQVTNTNNGYTSSVMSEAVFVTVQEPRITGIFVDSLPEKLIYQPGESLDAKGLRLKLNYENGSSAIIDSGFDVSPLVFTAPGKQQVQLILAAVRIAGQRDNTAVGKTRDGNSLGLTDQRFDRV